MTRALVGLLVAALGLAACGREPPPDVLVLDSELTAAQRAVVLDAADAWCSAVGWCPNVVDWAPRGRVELVDRLARGASGNNDGATVRIRRSDAEDLERLWAIAAHELGHYCAEHTHGGLMAAVLSPGDLPLAIDAAATQAWLSGCGE